MIRTHPVAATEYGDLAAKDRTLLQLNRVSLTVEKADRFDPCESAERPGQAGG
jgi:hypothetical protein